MLYIYYTDVIQCKYNACTMYRAYWVYYFLCALKINTLVHTPVAQLILCDFQFFSQFGVSGKILFVSFAG